MWNIIPCIILLAAYTTYMFAKGKTAKDFIFAIISLIMVCLLTVGVFTTSSKLDKDKADIAQLHYNYREEIQNTKYTTIQETMQAYYDQRISETCTVVDGVTVDVQYSIKPSHTELELNKQ